MFLTCWGLTLLRGESHSRTISNCTCAVVDVGKNHHDAHSLDFVLLGECPSSSLPPEELSQPPAAAPRISVVPPAAAVTQQSPQRLQQQQQQHLAGMTPPQRGLPTPVRSLVTPLPAGPSADDGIRVGPIALSRGAVAGGPRGADMMMASQQQQLPTSTAAALAAAGQRANTASTTRSRGSVQFLAAPAP